MQTFCLGLDRIDEVASAILMALPTGGRVILKGTLASGKTTLVKHIAALKGIDESRVVSPTFSIFNQYESLFHYDLYRSGFEGIVKNGLFEQFEQNALHLIEWGDEALQRAFDGCGLSYIIVEIDIADKNKRIYKVY